MNHLSTPTVPVTERGRKRREQLLRAAEKVFGQKGFERASIADVTQKAGTALGTFYVYFPDKKAIFVELVDELGKRLRDRIRKAVSACATREEMEREGFREFFRYCDEHRDLYSVVRQAEFVDLDAYRRYYAAMSRGYVRGIERAMAAGELAPQDPETVAYCLMGACDFLGSRFVIHEPSPDIDALVERAMQFIRHGLSPRPAPVRKTRRSSS